MPRHFAYESTSERRPSGGENRRLRRIAGYTLAAVALEVALLNAPQFVDNVEAASSHAGLNDQVSEIASEVAGRPIRVDCNDQTLDQIDQQAVRSGKATETAGVVRPLSYIVGEVSLPVTTLRTGICKTLVDFNPMEPAPDKMSEQYQAYISRGISFADALGILTHEEEHINQVFNEAAATCYAFQKLPQSLGKLGMSADVAHTVSVGAAYETETSLPPNYLSHDCKPGGALDIKQSDIYITDTNQ